MQLLYTKCSHDDLDQLVRISRTTFIATFHEANNPEDFNTVNNIAFDKEKIAAELHDPNTTFYFVEHGKDLVAYFKLNENEAQTDLKSRDSLEMERIYVLKEFQKKGIGKWKSEQLINESWIKKAIAPSNPNVNYGYKWWLNKKRGPTLGGSFGKHILCCWLWR